MSNDLAAELAAVHRRLAALETMPRSQPAAIAAGTQGFEITAFGQDVWQSDPGNATPQVTLRTGTSVGIFAQWRPLNVGTGGSSAGVNDFRSGNVVMGIQIDGQQPQKFALPPMRSQVSIFDGVGAYFYLPLTFSVFRSDLTPGEHSFTMRFYAFDDAPAKTLNPLMTDTVLAVLPVETLG